MGIISCDHSKCNRIAYGEIFMESEDEHFWVYACWWHYLIERIRNLLGKNDYGFCRIENTRESIEFVRMDLWEMQGDITKIKKKLGIEDEELEDKENIDVT